MSGTPTDARGTERRPRRWLASALFLASVVALLATSPARWTKPALLVGPATAASGRGLDLVITSSQEPEIRTRGPMASPYTGGTPCLAPWSPSTRVSCLLPPGAVIEEVAISERCGGCTGPCVAPKGAFVDAASAEIDVWKAVATAKAVVPVPDHAVGFVATSIRVAVDGAEFIEVELEITAVSSGATLEKQQQSCARQSWSPTPVCQFLLYDDKLATKPMDVSLLVTATGWGRCASGPCIPPGTLRVVSTTVHK